VVANELRRALMDITTNRLLVPYGEARRQLACSSSAACASQAEHGRVNAGPVDRGREFMRRRSFV